MARGTRTRGAGIPVNVFAKSLKKILRDLCESERYATYFPFWSWRPPVKVRSLSQRLVKLGHKVTVLTADGVYSHMHWRRGCGQNELRLGGGWRERNEAITCQAGCNIAR